MNDRQEILKRFNKFLDIIEKLRHPEEGCPWDKKQTIFTMKDFFLEECYELMHEVEANDASKISDELGDVMLLIALCAQIESESGRFDMGDVLSKISEKLIERHPHVFGDTTVDGADDVVKKWDQIKREKGRKKSITDDLKMNVPPLLWAYKAQKRLANIGFDFKTADETLVKVREEYGEFMHAIEQGDAKHVEHELGDMFFALINYARHASINPDTALISSVTKFIDRVRFIEENSDGHYGRKMEELTMAEMDSLWDLAKKNLKK